MTQQLLLFIQSSNPGVYVNTLTHCFKEKRILSVYFAINGDAVGKTGSEKNIILDVQKEFKQLILEGQNLQNQYNNCLKYNEKKEISTYKNLNDSEYKKIIKNYNDYKDAYNKIFCLSETESIEQKFIKISFTNPEKSINDIKQKFINTENLFVDISGCNKKLASDIISSFILKNIKHICCFELDDEVYSKDWSDKGLKKMYHDLRKDTDSYEYIDFSESGTTIRSFDNMRQQGKLIRVLVVVSLILAIFISVLIQQEELKLAQYTGIMMILANGAVFLNNSSSFFKLFK